MSNLAGNAQSGPDARARWAEIRSVADRLLHHARNQEWEAVGELHALRDELLRDSFADPVAVSDANEVREGILAVLESDKEVIALTRQERSNAVAEVQRLQSGREAGKAYADVRKGHRQ